MNNCLFIQIKNFKVEKNPKWRPIFSNILKIIEWFSSTIYFRFIVFVLAFWTKNGRQKWLNFRLFTKTRNFTPIFSLSFHSRLNIISEAKKNDTESNVIFSLLCFFCYTLIRGRKPSTWKSFAAAGQINKNKTQNSSSSLLP